MLYKLFLSLLLCLSYSNLFAENYRIKYDSIDPREILEQVPNFFKKTLYRGGAKLSDKELLLLQEGDFILRKGYGWISDRIASILNEQYPVTHCAVILRKGYSVPMVLHSLSNNEVNGIFIEPLTTFLQESQPRSLVGLRLRASPSERKKVVAEAKRLLNKAIPFDLAFDESDSTKMYCAELFAYIFKNIFGEDLLQDKLLFLDKKLIRMRNFFDPKIFEIRFNQFDASP